MTFHSLEIPTAPQELPAIGRSEPRRHLYTEDEVHAVQAALNAQRPLLVCGEPGTGKSQLARAAAALLKRPFLRRTVDARTESRDLLWDVDDVRRLADAQLIAVLARMPKDDREREQDPAKVRAKLTRDLDLRRYVVPGPLWWAFDWSGAKEQAKLARVPPPVTPEAATPANGCVLLIDEIDKGEADVPNGLLEALGSGGFQPPAFQQPVCVNGPSPLIVITTNGERMLPDAFIRRCLVLHLETPEDPDALTKYLMDRGRAHFSDTAYVSPDVLIRAAELLIEDRTKARRAQIRPYPGLAEYLDLVRAVAADSNDASRQLMLLDRVSRFVLGKRTRNVAI